MTSVLGHLTGLEFTQQYRKWHSCAPGQLFDAEVIIEVAKVGMIGEFSVEKDANFTVGQESHRREHQETGTVCQSLVYLDRL